MDRVVNDPPEFPMVRKLADASDRPRHAVVTSAWEAMDGRTLVRLVGQDQPLFTGPGGVLTGADDPGVDRDGPVEVALGVGLGEQGG
ncbi:hypothetical protein ACFV7Q_32700 [Streptomyces sp. NPDC059851]|uniref:hypothetical protein n=1 Tax=Streptomyces sp. NPDC059851 TaxID=3346971 RepID=UPI00364DC06B